MATAWTVYRSSSANIAAEAGAAQRRSLAGSSARNPATARAASAPNTAYRYQPMEVATPLVR